MEKSCVFLSLALILVQYTANTQNQITLPECDGIVSVGRTLKVSVNSQKNKADEWVTTFSAFKNSTGPSPVDHITMDVTHRAIDCRGYQLIHIQGVLKENSSKTHKKSLLFDQRCSKTVAVTNNGKTLQKIKLDDHGAALTNRPLMDNEIFQVRLDKKFATFNYAIGIGVMTLAPGTFDMPNHMNTDKFKIGTWMLYNMHIYQGGPILINNYLKNDLRTLQVGSLIGVMRSSSGALHFYINGVDQGPAVSNIPTTVYGVFELFGDAAEVTILDPVSSVA